VFSRLGVDLADIPHLVRDDITAAIAYAAMAMGQRSAFAAE
jgi:uncharacterized protein (DUF433 family)